MPQPKSICRYRGYIIGVEHRNGFLLVTTSPAAPELPILHRYSLELTAQSETEAMIEAKCRIDLLLSS